MDLIVLAIDNPFTSLKKGSEIERQVGELLEPCLDRGIFESFHGQVIQLIHQVPNTLIRAYPKTSRPRSE